MVEKMKNRIFISVINLVLLISILSGSIFLIRKNTNHALVKRNEEKQTVQVEKDNKEKKKVKATEQIKENQKKVEFENMNYLEVYFPTEEIESLQEKAESFLQQDEVFADVTKMTCTKAVYETQSQIRFYFTLDDGAVLFVNYKKEEKSYFLWTEEKKDSERAIADWLKQKESETKTVDANFWEEEQQLPIEWKESGQENIPVTLSGKENLQGKIPEEKLNDLETEIQKFLEENNELRRKISIPADRIVQTEDTVTFEVDFTTERIDKKHLQVTYHISEKSFGFSLQ